MDKIYSVTTIEKDDMFSAQVYWKVDDEVIYNESFDSAEGLYRFLNQLDKFQMIILQAEANGEVKH